MMAWTIFGCFTIFTGQFGADDGMGTFDLVVNGLAQVMQETGTFGLLDVDTEFGSHDAAEKCHLQGVLIDILAVGGAVPEAADQLEYLRMDAVYTQIERRLLTGLLDGKFDLFFRLVNNLLDPAGVDAAVSDQFFQRNSATSRRTGLNPERMTASGVSSMIRSMPVAASRARMLRPSRPIMRPFISSDGSGTTETVRSATYSPA